CQFPCACWPCQLPCWGWACQFCGACWPCQLPCCGCCACQFCDGCCDCASPPWGAGCPPSPGVLFCCPFDSGFVIVNPQLDENKVRPNSYFLSPVPYLRVLFERLQLHPSRIAPAPPYSELPPAARRPA